MWQLILTPLLTDTALPVFPALSLLHQASMADLNVVDFVFADPLLHSSGLDVSREEIVTQLSSVGFTDEMLGMIITSLSGGWKMKLALARAMLMKVGCRASIFIIPQCTSRRCYLLPIAAYLQQICSTILTVTSVHWVYPPTVASI